AALAGRPRDHRHDRTSVDRSHPGRPAVLAHRAPAVDPWLTSRAPAATRRPNLLGPPIPRPDRASARPPIGPPIHHPAVPRPPPRDPRFASDRGLGRTAPRRPVAPSRRSHR